MLSTFAATAPIAMASRVRSASGVASSPVKPPVGLVSKALTALATVPAPAPTIPSSAQERKSPSPDHKAIAFLLVSGLEYLVWSDAYGCQATAHPHDAPNVSRNAPGMVWWEAPGCALLRITPDAIRKMTVRTGKAY